MRPTSGDIEGVTVECFSSIFLSLSGHNFLFAYWGRLTLSVPQPRQGRKLVYTLYIHCFAK